MLRKICILEVMLKLLILSCEFPPKHIPEEQMNILHFEFGGEQRVAFNINKSLSFYPKF